MESEDAVPSNKLPAVFGPLEEERDRIERILDRLETTEDLTERADLGSELVRSASRYEDTLERVVWPSVSDTEAATFKELQDDRTALREVMVTIHEATMHIDPRNVHASDPQGFEDMLDLVCERLRAILLKDDHEIAAIDATLGSPEEREKLTNAIAHAMHNASERPNPPKTAIGRFVSNASVKLDHTFEDVSAPQHPGADTING
jgi:hypothetical protein